MTVSSEHLGELEKYSEDLYQKERWLVLNKTDLVDDETLREKQKSIMEALDWSGSVYSMSALSKTGTQDIVHEIMKHIEQNPDIS